jgi:DNA-directed RNA polymerase specialized sigma24 family protein
MDKGKEKYTPEYDSESVSRLPGWTDVPIPSNQFFLKQWYAWTLKTVSRHFRRDKERIQDTAQNVRLRWLSKDGIGRWFYKHLTDELVNRDEAERMLGGMKISFNGALNPVHGNRMDATSLWRIAEILKFAQFDYDRYYYSVQNHTIDSVKTLQLLGYPPGQFSLLQSMYRQGRLQPAELTEHTCSRRGKIGAKPRTCSGCVHGLSLLRMRGLSLADDWSDSSVRIAVEKLRWNDSQLRPYLRSWRRANIIQCVPQHIMRESRIPGVDAGLLAYAEMVFNNEVVNDFKRMSRSDDMSMMIFNNGMSPEMSDDESIGFEMDEETETSQKIVRDPTTSARLSEFEVFNDLRVILKNANLTDEEREVIEAIDLHEMTVRQFATQVSLAIPKIHRTRASAMRKLRDQSMENGLSFATHLDILKSQRKTPLSDPVDILTRICNHFGCTPEDISGPCVVGPIVLARSELFTALFDLDWGITDMANYFSISEERVTAAINRRVLRDMREQT